MDVGDSSVNLEILLFGAGKGHCNMMAFYTMQTWGMRNTVSHENKI